MAEHAVFAPSDAARWMNCPGAVNATMGLPNEDSYYSLEGTLAHKLLEECLLGDKPAKSFVGKALMDSVPEMEFSGIVPKDMAPIVQECVDHVKEKWYSVDDMELFTEVRVDPGIPGVWGTVDILLASKSTRAIYLEDLKYGQGVMVEVEDNEQLQTYICGALEFLCARWTNQNGRARPMLWDYFKTIEVGVMQPRGRHPQGKFRSTQHTVDELRDFHRQGRQAVEAAMAPDAPRIGGEKQCRWCAVKATCPGASAVLMEKAQSVFTQVPEAGDTDAVRYILENGDRIISLINAVKENHIKTIMEGGDALGYKVVAGQSKRRWTEDTDTVVKSLQSIGIPKTVSTEASLRSPAQIEKEIKAKGGTDKAMEKRWDAFNSMVEKPEGKPKLVPEDAPGSSIRTAEQVFTKVEPVEALLN